MEQEQLKAFRKKTPISIKEAIELLNKNNGDLAACEKEFHRNKIDEISKITACEKAKAKKFYEQFNFNKEKAIRNINEEQRVLTIEDVKVAKRATGFVLCGEDENGMPYKTVKRNEIFIPTEDFDYIKAAFAFNSAPSFDIRGANYFNEKDGQLIIQEINKLETRDHPKLYRFL